jgi:Tfp pilus assembly protein PilV
MEVMVAVVIFSMVLTAVLRLMSTGDRINGRRLWLSHATILAANQAELIRQQENSLDIMGDTSYDQAIDGQNFHVDRKRIGEPADKFSDTASYLEFTITVNRSDDNTPLVHFRLLQGKNAGAVFTKK